MANNSYIAVNVRLTADPKTKTIKVGGKEKQLVEVTFAENPWNEKRFLTKFVTASYGAETRDGKKAAERK